MTSNVTRVADQSGKQFLVFTNWGENIKLINCLTCMQLWSFRGFLKWTQFTFPVIYTMIIEKARSILVKQLHEHVYL